MILVSKDGSCLGKDFIDLSNVYIFCAGKNLSFSSNVTLLTSFFGSMINVWFVIAVFVS